MALLDFLLNLACLLLWLHWRTLGFKLLPIPGRSLLMTLQRTQVRPRRHLYLLALGAVLFGRALFYSQVGTAARWTPVWSVGTISIAFGNEHIAHTVLYSLLSFARMLGVFYLWLLVLSVLNKSVPDSNSPQRLVRLHLGRLESWPAAGKLLLPLGVVSLVWLILQPLLEWLGLSPGLGSWDQRLLQALLVGAGVYLTAKLLLVGLLVWQLVHSYVYVGERPFLNYLSQSANHLLGIFPRPLRVGRIDLTPFLAILLVLALARGFERLLWYLLVRLQ